jgi:hypothetical protein
LKKKTFYFIYCFKPWKDLIDLRNDETNNTNKNSRNIPSLPNSLPSGDDHINENNKLPPPFYYPNIDNNNVR